VLITILQIELMFPNIKVLDSYSGGHFILPLSRYMLSYDEIRRRVGNVNSLQDL
jgi:hypothetical protein